MRAQKKHTTKVLIVAAALLLLVGGYLAYAYTSKAAWPFNASVSDTTQTQPDDSDINYSPPTDQEKASSQDGKKNSEDPSQPTESKTSVSVDISYAGSSDDSASIEIRAFTTDVIEGTGTCTATLTHNGKVVTATSKGFVDARSTICEPIEISQSKLEAGTWKLVVTYTSPSDTGASSEIEVEVK